MTLLDTGKANIDVLLKSESTLTVPEAQVLSASVSNSRIFLKPRLKRIKLVAFHNVHIFKDPFQFQIRTTYFIP